MPSRLQVLIVNDFAHINGGAGQVALSSALALAERGHQVTVFSSVAPVMAELREGRVKLVCTNQHELTRDPNRLRAAGQGIWNYRAARHFDRLLARSQPNQTVVHLHGWSKSLTSSVVRTAISRDLPLVLTLHDYFVACPNGGFYNYQTDQICRLTAMSPACLGSHCDKQSYSRKVWRVGRQVVQRRAGGIPDGIDHFIYISQFSREILSPYLPKRASLHFVRNPIDIPRSEYAPAHSTNRLVSVGRLTPEKGPFLFATAARRARDCVPVFVGEGECRLELERLHPEAEITGWLSHAEVRESIRKSAALVLPSLWYETQGLVVLEAAALGRAAIVPDGSAAREAVIDGQTGLWFKGGDPTDLATKIDMMLDGATAERMGRAAYERYWSHPSRMEQHVSDLETVYDHMLADRHHSTNSMSSERSDRSIPY